MCGILVIKDPSKIDSIKHRGIQFTSIQKNGWIYGHHRLPIQTTEDDQWFQPIELSDGGFLLFNGEIFNYNEFSNNKFDSDSEYLKDLFDTERPIKELIEEMNLWDGFWSIVLIRGKKLTAFTDPLGKKQLYINKDGEISSEVKGLSNSGIIDPIFISIVNKWGYNTDDRTLYTDVKRIIPNTIYIWNSSYPQIISNYYKWENKVSEAPVIDLLEESVKRRLISKKYKVSTLFSGGLDSTIILYFLRKFGSDVNIYSIDNAEDGEYVRMMEDYWDLKINYLDQNIGSLSTEDRMRIYDINDSMIDLGSVLPQYFLFKNIEDKIVLTGDGADEIFGGYRRINQYDSQKSDVFQELPFYHLPRIDRMSMNFTIECRNPFLGHDVVKKALSLPFEERKNKKVLKDSFKGLIPDEIIDRKKNPLKIKSIRENEQEYRYKLVEDYLKWKNLNIY